VTTTVFPDNTALINFAIIHRLDLLATLTPTRAWCVTIANECARSSREPGLADLAHVPDLFGEPLVPDVAEHQDILVLRETLAAPGDGRYQHLGEAETLAIVSRRAIAALFVTDDRGARIAAARLRIPVVTTWKLLEIAVRANLIDEATHRGYIEQLRLAGRHLPRT
jgi:predicted nucleic acid-binding protein